MTHLGLGAIVPGFTPGKIIVDSPLVAQAVPPAAPSVPSVVWWAAIAAVGFLGYRYYRKRKAK